MLTYTFRREYTNYIYKKKLVTQMDVKTRYKYSNQRDENIFSRETRETYSEKLTTF